MEVLDKQKKPASLYLKHHFIRNFKLRVWVMVFIWRFVGFLLVIPYENFVESFSCFFLYMSVYSIIVDLVRWKINQTKINSFSFSLFFGWFCSLDFSYCIYYRKLLFWGIFFSLVLFYNGKVVHKVVVLEFIALNKCSFGMCFFFVC